jgi:1-deoxy-D-xylulose-5-phosphate synthase
MTTIDTITAASEGASSDDSGDLAGWPLLAAVRTPVDVRALSAIELRELAGQIREFLIDRVCAAGGHLGASLGVVELTIALHRVFHSPRDAIVFDTGHQSYVHKILTGRALGFTGLRRSGEMSGYPNRVESEHDWVENSHASTALSYADGLAKAFALGDRGRRAVAVIGDGALTGGLAWEGLNNLAARPDRPLVVVVNDNGRSYDPTIGGIAHHLRQLRENRSTDSLFERLGLVYVGPVDGHDIGVLERVLQEAKDIGRTVVVHAVTGKGRGYRPAETDEADRMHAVGVIDPRTGRSSKPGSRTWTDVFAEEILRLGQDRPELVCVSAAMVQPVGLGPFARAFPDRIFDTGIAEQHAVCSAAGLAMGGLHPVVAVYSTFLNRAFDQILLDVALHRLPVTFVLDRSGITGPDGPSHHGIWDTGILAMVPGMRVAAPRDPARLRELLGEAVTWQAGPTTVRYPKATAAGDIPALAQMDGIDVLYRSRSRPLDVLVVSAGVTATVALQAAPLIEQAGYGVTVVDPRWVHPIAPGLPYLAARHRTIVTVEDACVAGGLGTHLAAACAQTPHPPVMRFIGVPRQFIAHGIRPDLLAECGIDARHIARIALDALTDHGEPIDSILEELP